MYDLRRTALEERQVWLLQQEPPVQDVGKVHAQTILPGQHQRQASEALPAEQISDQGTRTLTKTLGYLSSFSR